MAKWFRTRLREARRIAGLSQAELGDKFGVSQGAISFWENDNSEPQGETWDRVFGWIEKIAVFTDVSTAVERSERPPSLVPIESGGRWSTSISAAAFVHPASRVPVEGRL